MATKMKKIDLTEMNPYQLAQLKQQLDGEVEVLDQSIQSLLTAKNKYQESWNSVERQKKVTPGSEVLVPLTGSMYIPGQVIDNDKFLVDIGTGYYVEKNQKSASDFFKRKVQFLTEQIDKYVKLMQDKAGARDAIFEMLQIRQHQAMNQQQQAQSQQIASSSQK